MTGGLDTKKKIVAKFGEDAAFEKGQALPDLKGDTAQATAKGMARVVRAKPPVVRKTTAGNK